METANNWSNKPEFDIGTRSGILRSEFIAIIERIQLDAWKQGMHDAGDIVIRNRNNGSSNDVIVSQQQIFRTLSNRERI